MVTDDTIVLEELDVAHTDSTVVLGEDYHAAVSAYEHAASRFQHATRTLNFNARTGGLLKAISFVTGLSHRELPKEAEANFLELLDQAQKLNAMDDADSTRKDLEALCSQRLCSIARMLKGFSNS